jgi:hypothetical protein
MESLVQVIAASFAVFGFIALVVAILMIVATWMIYSKAGKPGWASIIPFYSDYVLSDIVLGNANYFIASIVCMVAMFVFRIMGIGFLISLVSLAFLVLRIYVNVKLAKAFNQGGGFAAGLVLLPVIFYPILGFGSSKYAGPNL